MKEYDFLYILKPNLGEETYSKTIESINNIIEKTGGEVFRTDAVGARTLATEFKRQKQGYYVNVEFQGNNATLDEIRNYIKVSEYFIRDLIVQMDSIRPNKKNHVAVKAEG